MTVKIVKKYFFFQNGSVFGDIILLFYLQLKETLCVIIHENTTSYMAEART